jgi:hypothetical protein
MASTNIFALLDNEDGAPSSRGGDKKAKSAAAAKGKKELPTHSFPGEQPAGQKQAPRVPKAEKVDHREAASAGASGRGGRGGSSSRGGRGGRAQAVGEDHSRREFDRRGAPTKHAPHRAQKDGAALGPEGGAAAAVNQGESVAEATAVEEVVDDIVIPQLDEVSFFLPSARGNSLSLSPFPSLALA